MPRDNPEWIGRTPSAPIPPRVKLRLIIRYASCCYKCRRGIHPGDKWSCDHIKALINGGEHREDNLAPICAWCKPLKDAFDLTEKSITARKRMKHHGIRPKLKSRPIAGTAASGWRHKMDGTWVRR